MSTSAKQYIRELSDLLCCDRSTKEQFLLRFQTSLESFESEHDASFVSYDELVSEFGTPKETADAFLSQLNTSQVQPLLKASRRRKTVFILLGIIAIILLAGIVLYRIHMKQLAQEGYFNPPVYELSPEEAETFDPEEFFKGK